MSARAVLAAATTLLSLGLSVPAMPGAFAAPVIERAAKGERCVEETASMRRNHMRFLEHTRDATVRGGIRGNKHSLKGCIDCHASRATGSVAQASGDFCVACHTYTAVKIDCFDCHATKPAAAVAAAPSAAAATVSTAASAASAPAASASSPEAPK